MCKEMRKVLEEHLEIRRQPEMLGPAPDETIENSRKRGAPPGATPAGQASIHQCTQRLAIRGGLGGGANLDPLAESVGCPSRGRGNCCAVTRDR